MKSPISDKEDYPGDDEESNEAGPLADDVEVPTNRILAVDDDPVNIQVLKNILRWRDCSVSVAYSGIDALNMIESGERFDLILLDVMMPGMSGYEVCRKLRLQYSLLELPILMLTARNRIQDIEQSFLSGANDHLSKPFDMTELLARVRTLLSLKRAVTRAIQNEKLAITDGLTGLYNRRYFFELVEKEFAKYRRYGSSLSVCLMDIDHFKQVNDTHGHAVGDEVLRHLADRLRERFRKYDIVGRYGGEEFAVAFPETSLETATMVVERIRAAIEKSPMRAGGGEEIRYTLSFGVSGFSVDNEDIHEVFGEADKALYEAKAAGRNRVMVRRPANTRFDPKTAHDRRTPP